MLRYLFYKKTYPYIRILRQLGQWYRVKQNICNFILVGFIWVTGLSGDFDYNQVFLGTFTTGMSKLHQFLLTFCESKIT